MGRNCCMKCRDCGTVEGGKEKKKKEKKEERSRTKKIRQRNKIIIMIK